MIEHPEHGPLLSTAEVAALLGVTEQELRAHMDRQPAGERTSGANLPEEWLEQARSRGDVYRQATGRDDMAGALTFWQAQRGISEGGARG